MFDSTEILWTLAERSRQLLFYAKLEIKVKKISNYATRYP